jgi:hypothetical protein
VQRPGRRKNQSHHAGRLNTLGLSGRELAELLNEFDLEDPEARRKRDFVRWPFRLTSLRVDLEHPGGNSANIRIACRNISRGGMSLLHSAYLHPGTRCTVHLPHPEDGDVAVLGYVARCRYRSGMVHEVGIAFAQHLDVRAFVPSLRDDALTLELVDPALLVGSILCIGDSEKSLQIMRQHLAKASMHIQSCGSRDASPSGAFDVLVVAHPACSGEEASALARLRAAHARSGLLVITSHHRDTARRAMASLHPDLILVRPIEREALLRALGELLIVRSRGDAGRDPIPADCARPRVDVGHIMRHCAGRLQEYMDRCDAAACRALCVQMAGAGPALGVAGVGRLAEQIAHEIERTAALTQCAGRIALLIAACRRAQASAA